MSKATEPATVGRPALSEDEPTVIVSVTMPESYRTWLHSQNRSTSAAVRALIEAAMEAKAKK
jgi:hypothetical protein